MMKAVIFDLDGTLIDSMAVWDKIGRDFLTAKNIAVPDDLGTSVKNLSFTESARYYIERFGLNNNVEEIINTWNRMASRDYAENIQLKDGVYEYLLKLKDNKIKMGIATATHQDLVESVLRHHGIRSFFQAILTVFDVDKGKENPDIFQATACKLKVRPEECLVFEDSLHAVQGAKKAGMTVWAVYDPASAHERYLLERTADRYLENFNTLLGGN